MVLLILVGLSQVLSAQADLGPIVPANQPIHLVGIGDWGDGGRAQVQVAEGVAKRHAEQRYDLGITLGDNFYRCGVRSTHDPKWQSRWERYYAPLGIQFYATLGNHDYAHPPIICPQQRGSPDAEVAYTKLSKTWRMPARYYTFTAGPVRFIAIDTEGWTNEQLKWVEDTLKRTEGEPGIRWKVVYGHHPIYTSGVHLNERRIGVLRRDLLPVLKAAHVDLYICGHDHEMERLESDGMDFLINGGGGAKLRDFRGIGPNTKFNAVVHGFLDLKISEHELSAQFLSSQLEPLDAKPLVRRK